MRLILLGPPGCGKGTQAATVVQRYGVPQISTGDLLRQERSAGSDLGRRAADYMDKGELVPDQLVLDMLKGRLAQADCATGFVLDGFPRTVPQAKALDALLCQLVAELDAVVDLEVPDEEIESRITGRRTCPTCNLIYHLATQPPQTENRCDKCGGDLVHRSDDSVETVRNRLRVYHEQTQPLIEYYRATGKLHEIDGIGDLADIAESIRQALDA